MSFWSFWSRRTARGTPTPPNAAPAPPERSAFTDDDRQFVHDALFRFEACGLSVLSSLDRDLIVVRALIDIERWKGNGAPSDVDLPPLFQVLATGTDSLTYFIDAVGEMFAPLAAMDEDEAGQMLDDHSHSIFVNAGSITTVNEDNSLENMVYDLAELGNLDVSQTGLNVMKNGLTRVTFQVEGVGECHFDIGSSKRPDITPAFAEMNRIARENNLGRFIIAPEGNSESETFIFATEALIPGITELLKLSYPGLPSG